MSYPSAKKSLLKEKGIEESTMMGSPCLRYKGSFIGMMFKREDALIVKLSPERVKELIGEGVGAEFNFTKKVFKEWVLISMDHEKDFEGYIREALAYAQLTN